jgi:ABC-type iron transport system FetAB ATPase subunit
MEKPINLRLRVAKLSIHDVGPVSLDIEHGECVGLSGPSGSGKTLILRAIADLEPHAGRIHLDGKEQAQVAAPVWRRRVAMLPAESAWWADTVSEHFVQADTKGFERLGFDAHILNWPVSRLSSGERQRLALLRLLENQPRLLLLDEPTANLDEKNTAKVEDLIRSYCKQTGAAAVWVGHQVAQLRRVANRFYSIVGGRFETAGEFL